MAQAPSRNTQGPALRLVSEGEPALPPPSDFDALFQRFAPYVATIGLRMLGRDDGEVDDLVQEVFFEAYRGLHTLQQPGAVKGWLACIAVRQATRRLKRRRLRALFRAQPLHDYAQLAEASASPEQAAQVQSAYRLLDTLGASERVVWVLRHVEGHSLDEIAVLCACSKSTVQRRLRTAEAELLKVKSHG
jgi:RNA polymerase sigma-70 factor (ECF subfamily)